MLSDKTTIDPGFAVVINRAEVQENALAGPFVGYVEGPVIPDRRHKVRVLDARETGFRAEGNGDGAV